MSTLQAQDNGTPNRQTPRSASKKHDDAFKLPKRPMSPILPEIPVFVLNENGMFVEEDKHIPQKPVMRDGDSQTDTTASQDKVPYVAMTTMGWVSLYTPDKIEKLGLIHNVGG